MRDDALAYALDENRFGVSPDTAWDMYNAGQDAVTGADVARAYGLLAHYINRDRLALIIQSDRIGPGCWLTPTAYAACITPYNLGLDSPRNMCLLIDVSELPRLWGPGKCGASGFRPNIWRGGGIEFFTPDPVPFGSVRHIIELETCGDEH
jgi:hypothetical protein